MTLHHIADTARFTSSLHGLLPAGGKIAIADLDTESGDFHNTGVTAAQKSRAALVGILLAKCGKYETLRFRAAVTSESAKR